VVTDADLVPLDWEFTAPCHGKGKADGATSTAKDETDKLILKEERWLERQDGEEFVAPRCVAEQVPMLREVLANKRNKEGKVYNVHNKHRIFEIRVGEVDYSALVDYETVTGCMKHSSFMGRGSPNDLLLRASTCKCAACVARPPNHAMCESRLVHRVCIVG
jgi:hypothetical protein